jgi:hypothetical protein
MGDTGSKNDEQTSIAEVVEKAIQSFITNPDKKAVTYTEFLRLVELQKELNTAKPKEIIIRWVEPKQTESSDK